MALPLNTVITLYIDWATPNLMIPDYKPGIISMWVTDITLAHCISLIIIRHQSEYCTLI